MHVGPGTRLGPYEISALLGAGGMGEVFRAIDTRLDRQVAIKVLSSGLIANPELKQRFEREARAISSLNHPYICALYDVGSVDDVEYLVMELLEGESLADRLARGPLPLNQVLRYGTQISDALDRAHRQHIVHRDLKPGNIMLTRSGLKLLDFGLAKLTGEAGLLSQASQSAVQTVKPLTTEGSILGTLQYMSPEQLEGKEVDARSDIFALGAVLFEMTTGRRPFNGSSQASLIAAILHDEPPPLGTLQPLTPPALDRIVRTCLAKDPEDRWQTARDLTLQLQALTENISGSTLANESVALPRRQGLSLWWRPLAIGLIAGIAMTLPFMLFRKPVHTPVRHLSMVLPDPVAEITTDNVLAVSEDGSKVVYVARHLATTQLHLRLLASSEDHVIAKTVGATGPFLSPDGESVGFFQEGHLRTMSLSGGSVADLGEVGPGKGASWSTNGMIAFVGIPSGSPVSLVSAKGGPIRTISKVRPNEGGHGTPHFLPGGKQVLYTAEVDGKSYDEAVALVVDIETGRAQTVLEGAYGAQFVRGQLLFGRGGKLYTIPFDEKRFSTTGVPVELPISALDSPGHGTLYVDAAGDGTIVAVPGSRKWFDTRIVQVDRQGKSKTLPLESRNYRMPRIDPTGKRLLVEVTGANDDIWIYDLERETFSRATFNGENMVPEWDHDGNSFFVSRVDAGRLQLYQIPLGGGQPKKVFPSVSPSLFCTSVSRDGRLIAYATTPGGATGWDVYLLDRTTGTSRPVIAGRFNEMQPALSPDSTWIAYTSDESGQNEIYVQGVDRAGARTLISQGGGATPVWSHSGREIFFVTEEGLKSVPVTAREGSLAFGTAATVVAESGQENVLAPSYTVALDDQSFFISEGSDEVNSIRQIDVVRGLLP
ncbi:MAG TPA: protein kinase [Thermoanaerobaculia bacterium]|nr:protein kinase [Thermoanaerobaculia bacterium]